MNNQEPVLHCQCGTALKSAQPGLQDRQTDRQTEGCAPDGIPTTKGVFHSWGCAAQMSQHLSPAQHPKCCGSCWPLDQKAAKTISFINPCPYKPQSTMTKTRRSFKSKAQVRQPCCLGWWKSRAWGHLGGCWGDWDTQQTPRAALGREVPAWV